MSFTDDDLKRLKEDFNDHAMHTGRPFPLTQGALDALLSRLQAAELCLDYANCVCPKESHYKSCDFTERYNAWLKEAGK